MVEYGLPKPGVRVRFPLPAPAQEQSKGNFALLFYTKSFAVSLAPSLFRKKSRYATNFLRGSLRSHWFVQRLFCSYFSSILRWKKNICITPCSFASDKKLVSLPARNYKLLRRFG